MATYWVRVPVTMSICITVEADSEDEAKEVAQDSAEFRLAVEEFEPSDLVYEVEIEEWSMHEQIVQGNVFYGCQNKIEAEEA